ncbi:MAG: stage 0 sporulation family protein [Deltaproteobacteria bacterium]|nr:stage 0 sporulation family protein [Deltaproteobacteria bacterium]
MTWKDEDNTRYRESGENEEGPGQGEDRVDKEMEEESEEESEEEITEEPGGLDEDKRLPMPTKICAVRFRDSAQVFELLCHNLDLQPGDQVVAEGERGSQLATVIRPPRDVSRADENGANERRILRRARPTDLRQAHSNSRKEDEAQAYCKERIKARNLPMELVRVEFLHTGSKAIFYFSAESRVDFRELVRDLAQRFHIRVEMRQIGVRDAAKMLGGVGICGRELCCTSHLKRFAPVSIKMAKSQSLSLNPQKVSGVCGRLLCCLAYEHETYKEAAKSLPKVNKKAVTPRGVGKVREVDVLRGILKIQLQDGLATFDREEVRQLTQDEIKALNNGDEPVLPAPKKKEEDDTSGQYLTPEQKNTGNGGRQEKRQRGAAGKQEKKRNTRPRKRTKANKGGKDAGKNNAAGSGTSGAPPRRESGNAENEDRKKTRKRKRRGGRKRKSRDAGKAGSSGHDNDNRNKG